MLFETPSDDDLYAALVNRDGAYDGRWYVGVTSTGIFCRLTCPARKPLRENCRFFEDAGSCIEAGFRPCKRCSPLAPAAEADPIVARLMETLLADPARRWLEQDIIALGIDPSTARRAFKRHYGMTFLELARLYRLGEGFGALAGGEQVIGAQMEAGFSSASGFREAFARWLGVSPGGLKKNGLLQASWMETPLGPMVAVADRDHLHLLEFADRKGLSAELQKLQKAVKGELGIGRLAPHDLISAELGQFFDGKSARFETPVHLWGTAFSRSVWEELRTIPAGETRSYAELAAAIGNPKAVRAVARANGANQLALIIPCHRVIGADGSLTGYAGGLWRKQKLIELEHAYRV